MFVDFNEILYDRLEPGTFVEVRPNYAGIGILPYPRRTLLMAPIVALPAFGCVGTAIPGRLHQITRPDDGARLFGQGSPGDLMVRARLAANRATPLYAMGVTIAAPTYDTWTIAFSGTGSGTVPFWMGGRRYPVEITAGMTPAQMLAATLARIVATRDGPMVAWNGTNLINVSTKAPGVLGADLAPRIGYYPGENVPAGITVTITRTITATAEPDIRAAFFDAIVDEWFTDFICPWSSPATLAILETELAARYRAMGKKDGHAYTAFSGTFGQATARLDTVNSAFVSALCVTNPMSPPYEIAASLEGICSFHLNNDPARQLRGLVLPGILPPAVIDRFTEDERDLLLRAGCSTWTAQGDDMVLSRVITTAHATSLGIPDRAWMDIMVPQTLSRIRYDWATYVGLTYPRNKLAPDDSLAARISDAVVTPKRMHGAWAARCNLYAERAWIVDHERTVQESRFEIDRSDRNKMIARQQVMVIGNLMVLAAALEFQP
jgi:phage tail sheath gpL-like